MVAPNPQARGNLKFINGTPVSADDEIVSFVSRNLEPYRGFHVFMRSLPALQAARPKARVLIIGGDEVSYGRRLPDGQTYRQKYCDELGDRVDWSRVHFLGKLPYQTYLNVLQVSACHVYLTYPFVLSWSLTEAMSAGCRIVASRTPPVQELLTDGVNARLVDFFDSEELVTQIGKTLDEPDVSAALAAKARSTIVEHYDLRTLCLPGWLKLLKGENGGT